MTLYDFRGTLFLKVDKDQVDLKHEEHKTVHIPKGIWRVGRVMEFDPFSDSDGMGRTVED